MARTVINPDRLVVEDGLKAISNTAVDLVNGNEFEASGHDMVIAFATTGATFTLVSAPNKLGRTGDQNHAMSFGELDVLGPLDTEGWEQADGNIQLDADAAVNVMVLRLV